MYTAYGIVTLYKSSWWTSSTQVEREPQVLSQPVYCSATTTTYRVTISHAVYIQFDLLRMSTILLETCKGLYMNKEICALSW